MMKKPFYGPLAELVRQETRASSVVVLLVGATKGNEVVSIIDAGDLDGVVEMLRRVADDIEAARDVTAYGGGHA